MLAGVEFKRREKLLALVAATTITVVFGGLISTVIYVFFSGTLLVGLHASFRQKTEVDELAVLEEEGEALVEDGADSFV